MARLHGESRHMLRDQTVRYVRLLPPHLLLCSYNVASQTAPRSKQASIPSRHRPTRSAPPAHPYSPKETENEIVVGYNIQATCHDGVVW